jgi:hypothetical protein
MKRIAIASVLATALVISGCTAKERARSFGGEDSVDLACGQKLFDITWKESTLWFATKPMRETDIAETYTFQADSAYGIWEGVVTVKESRCEPTK